MIVAASRAATAGIRNAASATNNLGRQPPLPKNLHRAYDDRRANVATVSTATWRTSICGAIRMTSTILCEQPAGLRDVFGTGSTLAQQGANALCTAGGMLQMTAKASSMQTVKSSNGSAISA